LSGEVLLAAIVTLAGWAFTAGVFYRELSDLETQQARTEAREERIEKKLDQMQAWVNAVNVDKERKKDANK
jgi:hypothetical protein